ncbi:MAG TPA: glycoside hydrolase family 43 protein [Acidimicrobiales bacterium]|jgi:hypothetical protein
MLRITAPRPSGRVIAGAATLVCTLATGVALVGSADASTPRHPVVPVASVTGLTPNARALGAAAAGAPAGFASAYDEPAAAPDPQAPGVTILSGPDQPDPFLLQNRGVDYLFTSALKNSQGQTIANVPVRKAPAIGQWGPVRDALPVLPPWAAAGATWAPDAHQFGSHYILYFTAAVKYDGAQIECIGDAYSTSVTGPYLASAAPFVCQLADGGSIDPRTYVDSDGTPYLLWKGDNNSEGATPTPIFSQQLSSDGLHLLGRASQIFAPDELWQGTIVEAPDMIDVLGVHYLFYSGNWFNQPGYAIGVARCSGPLGPCADMSSTPLLASNAQGVGPGEESVFTDAQGIWLLYSPFRSTLPLPGPPRPVDIARLGFGPFGPYLAAPFATPANGASVSASAGR